MDMPLKPNVLEDIGRDVSNLYMEFAILRVDMCKAFHPGSTPA
jgi:hypothetical protein